MASKRRRLRLVVSNEPVRSDPHPMRLLQSGGHFERGNNRNAEIITLRDYPLAILHRTGRITDREFQAGENFYEDWYQSGLASTMSASCFERFSTGGSGCAMADDDRQQRYRDQYRDAVQDIGMLLAVDLEWFICWHVPIHQLARRCYGDEAKIEANIKKALQILAGA